MRTEYAEGSHIANSLFSPSSSIGLAFSFDIKDKLRISLGHEQSKEKVLNGSGDLEDKEFTASESYLDFKLKVDKTVFTQFAFHKKTHLLSDIEVDDSVATFSITPAELTQYKIGFGVIAKAQSLFVITSLLKIDIPKQNVSSIKIAGYGTEVNLNMQMKSGIGMKFQYINSVITRQEEGRLIQDERVISVYQRISF